MRLVTIRSQALLGKLAAVRLVKNSSPSPTYGTHRSIITLIIGRYWIPSYARRIQSTLSLFFSKIYLKTLKIKMYVHNVYVLTVLCGCGTSFLSLRYQPRWGSLRTQCWEVYLHLAKKQVAKWLRNSYTEQLKICLQVISLGCYYRVHAW
jgi:hypothetical protein